MVKVSGWGKAVLDADEFDGEPQGWAAALASRAVRAALQRSRTLFDEQPIENYLRRLLIEARQVRSVFHDDPEDIRAIYVKQTFEHRPNTIERQLMAWLVDMNPEEEFVPEPDPVEQMTEWDVIRNLEGMKRFVIRGAPGQGKSMFMRCASIAIAESNRIPVLVELRRLNSRAMTLRGLIAQTLGIPDDDQGADMLREMVNDNALVFLLDGLDEVFESRHRLSMSDEISNTFQGGLSQVPVVVTSRSEQSELLRGFDLLKLNPFDIEQARRLAKLISNRNDDFVQQFENNYFSKMPDIFGIPMFIHILYASREWSRPYLGLGTFLQRAIDHLSHAHDILKGAEYRRRKYEGYEPISHERLMTHLSVPLYVRSGSSWGEVELQKLIEAARVGANREVERTGSGTLITASAGAILDTLVKSIALVTFQNGRYEFKLQIFLEFYVAQRLLDELNRMPPLQRNGVMLTIEKGWVYRIMESLDSNGLNSKLIHPVTTAIISAVETRRDIVEIVKLFASSLVIDHPVQRIYLRSDGNSDSRRVVWSLLSNCLRIGNIILLTDAEPFEAVCRRLAAIGIDVGEDGERILSLDLLPPAFFDLGEVRSATDGVVNQLAEIHRTSARIPGGNDGDIPEIEI